jgi:DnaK suppressor protein
MLSQFFNSRMKIMRNNSDSKNIRRKNSSENHSAPVGVEPYKGAPEEKYMNSKQLEHFRKILEKWQQQLLEEATHTKEDIKSSSINCADMVDRASAEEEVSLELRARDRERKLLKKISEALQSINENFYGYCNECGSEIGIRRLEARPTATQCIECKTIAEMREKQIGEITAEE